MKRAVLLLALGLSACAVGPDYRRPATAVGDRWVEPADTADVDTSWWTQFEDPVLDRLIAQARASNLDLREAEARIAEARANRDAAAGGRLPQVEAKGSASENQLSENGQLPVADIPGFDRRFSLFDVGFDASWELDLWGRNRRQLEAANARVEAATWSRRDVEVSLLAEVARAYLDLRAGQARLAIAKAAAESLQATVRLAALRYEHGEDSKIAADEAASQAAAGEARVEQADAAIGAAAYRLATLLGVAPETIVPQLRATSGAIPVPPETIAMGIRSGLLVRRADVRRAERELAAATADVGVATADLFPRFSLVGSLGQQAREPGDLLSSASTRFSIGPSFSWPIFSAGRIRAQIRASDARADQAAARYEKAVIGALSDSEAAANRFARGVAAAQKAREAEGREQRAFELARLRQERGEDDRLALERARIKWLDARRATVDADADESYAAIALNKALGGSWTRP